MHTKIKHYTFFMNAFTRYCYHITLIYLVTQIEINYVKGCQIYSTGENLKDVRIPKNLEVGSQILSLKVFPRDNLRIMSADKESDSQYFSSRELNETHVSVILTQSLQGMINHNNSCCMLKFRAVCYSSVESPSFMKSQLLITVNVEGVNNKAAKFSNIPYILSVNEDTPVGSTLFCEIRVSDNDKTSTLSNDIHYVILDGNIQETFFLENEKQDTCLILKKPLDYDKGIQTFTLTIGATAKVKSPQWTNSSFIIKIKDNDDQNPVFTSDTYKAFIKTCFKTPKTCNYYQEIKFSTPIHAFDQDRGINIPMFYKIIKGNEENNFYLNPNNASLFLKQPIKNSRKGIESKKQMHLTIQATQLDNPLKFATSKVEIEISDLFENRPEFEVDFYNISIVENLPNGFSVLQVIAHDKDPAKNNQLMYKLEDQSGAFSVNSDSGWLIVKNESVLDRERRSSIKLKVFAVKKTQNITTSNSIVNLSNDNVDTSTSFVNVEVTILDVNDNNPIFFPSNNYELIALSDLKIGTILGRVYAIDKDQGRNGMVLYRLQRSRSITHESPFSVDAQTGEISVNESPMQEGKNIIFIEAMDNPLNPSERRFSLAVVTVNVIKSNIENLRSPRFIGAPYTFWIGVNEPIGHNVGQILLNKALNEPNEFIFDLLHSYHDGVPFAVEENSGIITLVDEIRKYKQPLYEFEAVIINNNEIILITNVTIYVADFNLYSNNNDDRTDKVRKILEIKKIKDSQIFHIKENSKSLLIGKMQSASLSTIDRNFRFFIANEQDVPEISITDDGTLYTNYALDREAKQTYNTTVIKETLSGIEIIQVTIIVDDENDNAPVFNSNSYEGYILENSPVNTEVFMQNKVSAYDIDSGANGAFVFVLRDDGNGDGNQFEINQINGSVFYKGTEHNLDREIKSVYNLKIVAVDKGNLQSETNLTIKVKDVNDNSPTFTQLTIAADQNIRVSENTNANSSTPTTECDNLLIHEERLNQPFYCYRLSRKTNKQLEIYIPENITLGLAILRLEAYDNDNDTHKTYSILSENFQGEKKSKEVHKKYFIIDSKTGEISVIRYLAPKTDIWLQVRVKDNGNLTDHMTLKIHVIDVNDHFPQFTQTLYSFDVVEGVYNNYKIGKVSAFDSDFGNNGNITYELTDYTNDSLDNNLNIQLNIEKINGDLFISGNIDREYSRNICHFRIKASDQGLVSLSSYASIEIKILDINDNAPVFFNYDKINKVYISANDEDSKQPIEKLIPVYETSVSEDIPIGNRIIQIFANDSDFVGNGNGMVLFKLKNSRANEKHYFDIDGKEGVVTTIDSLKKDSSKFHNLTIIASDLGSPNSLSSTAQLIVKVTRNTSYNENNRHDRTHNQKPIFKFSLYNVEIEENSIVPLKLVQIGLAESHYKLNHESLRYRISQDNNIGNASNYFWIDPKNGSLYLMKSVDREEKQLFEIIIRVDNKTDIRNVSKSLSSTSLSSLSSQTLSRISPTKHSHKIENLTTSAFNEIKVILKIKDVNDNFPIFKHKPDNKRPLFAAIQNKVYYGHKIIKLEAKDADEGINADIRYQIVSSNYKKQDQEIYSKFMINQETGQVKTTGNFSNESGRIFKIIVKATDRLGANDGLSSTIELYIYVVDKYKPVSMIVEKNQTDLEKQMKNITMILKNVTGFDVNIQKLESQVGTNFIGDDTTQIDLYTIETLSKIWDPDIFYNVFCDRKVVIERELEKYKLIHINLNEPNKIIQRILLSSSETGIIVFSCAIFLGTFMISIFLTCNRINKRNYKRRQYLIKRLHRARAPFLRTSYSDADRTEFLQETFSFQNHFTNCHQQFHPASIHCDLENSSSKDSQPCHNICDFELNGDIRLQSINNYRVSTGARRKFETSATSLYSCGHDSGVVERICHCSNTYSSDTCSRKSSNDYEDSLKSFQQHSKKDVSYPQNVDAISRKEHGIKKIPQLYFCGENLF